MKNKPLFFLPILLLLLLPACTPVISTYVEVTRGYSVGEECVAQVGEVIIYEEVKEVTHKKEYVGLGAPGGCWREYDYYSDDSFKWELVYGGRSGDTINILYREYRRDLARPAFFQNLTYDLSRSNDFAFKKHVIKVIAAGNSRIRFIVVSN